MKRTWCTLHLSGETAARLDALVRRDGYRDRIAALKRAADLGLATMERGGFRAEIERTRAAVAADVAAALVEPVAPPEPAVPPPFALHDGYVAAMLVSDDGTTALPVAAPEEDVRRGGVAWLAELERLGRIRLQKAGHPATGPLRALPDGP